LTAARKGKLSLFVTDGPEAMGDLIYINVLFDYMLAAATHQHIRGDFNLTNQLLRERVDEFFAVR